MIRLLPIFFLLFVGLHGSANAASVTFDDKSAALDLNQAVEYAITRKSLLTGDETWSSDITNIERNASDYVHFRVTIQNDYDIAVPLWFSIGFPSIKKLYVTDGVNRWLTGDALPFSSRPVLVPNYHFPTLLPASGSLKIYGHMQGEILRHDFFVATPEYGNNLYVDMLQRDMTFFGAMIILTVLCLVVFWISKKYAFLSFAVFIFATTFWFFRVFGYAFKILWPAFPQLNDITYAISIYSVLLASFWTLTATLKRPNRTIYAYNAIRYSCIALPFAGLLLWQFVSLDAALRLPVILFIPFMLLAITVLYKEHRSGSGTAKWLAAALFPVMASTITLILFALFDINLPVEPIATFMFGLLLTCTFMVVMTSNYLFKLLQKERDAEKALSKLKSEQAAKLEALVQERTQALEASNKMLNELALRDTLTNLPNRRSVDLFVDNSFAADTPHGDIAVALIDLDHFKNINDTYGHNVGDKVLIAVGNILQTLNDDNCIAGRFGGEEFAIVQRGISPDKFADTLLSVHKAINALAFKAHPKIRVGACIGWTMCNSGAHIVRSFRRADKALYQAKDEGRNLIIYAPKKSSQDKNAINT